MPYKLSSSINGDPGEFQPGADLLDAAERRQQVRLDFRPWFEAVYCVSLREQPKRAKDAAARLVDQGLGQNLTFHRPKRGKHVPLAVWRAHRDMARHALNRGFSRVLMLEDDVHFTVDGPAMLSRLSLTAPRLPDDWLGLYLGHLPMQMYRVGKGLVRARSGCAHAYVANEPLLHWLSETEPMDPEIPVCSTIGASVDAALANLPGMYALSPMIAVQQFVGDYRLDPRIDEQGRRRSLFDFARVRPLLLFHGLRFFEAVALVASPLHWITLEVFRSRSGRIASEAARSIRMAGEFDADWYIAANADVAASGRQPFEHFVAHGRHEGRRGSAKL